MNIMIMFAKACLTNLNLREDFLCFISEMFIVSIFEISIEIIFETK